jgi:hypothetical protein
MASPAPLLRRRKYTPHNVSGTVADARRVDGRIGVGIGIGIGIGPQRAEKDWLKSIDTDTDTDSDPGGERQLEPACAEVP